MIMIPIRQLVSAVFHHLNANLQRVNMNSFDMAKRHACSLCNKTFGRKYDLRRHENTVHDEDESSDEDNDEPKFKKHKEDGSDDEMESDNGDSEVDTDDDVEVNDSEDEDDSSEGEMSSDDLEDNPAYQAWYEQAMQATEEKRAKKYEKYINQNMTEEEAKEKAYLKTLWAVKRIFFDRYTTFLSLNLHLKDDDTHQDIMTELEEKTDEGKNIGKALKRTMAKHRSKFDGLFEYDEHEEDEEEEDEHEDGVTEA